MAHSDRADRAAETLAEYSSMDGMDPNSALIDLLADLMHYCNKEPSENFNDALSTARTHFDAEIWSEPDGHQNH